jgi:catechol 2,3-dioxygenase-like lactoylglutathione lyase family enzyme
VKVVPIRYTKDAEALARFYEVLGLEPGAASRPGRWLELAAESGMVAVHLNDPGEEDHAGRCELAFESDESLEQVAERLVAAGFEPGPVMDENFGQSLRVLDPDGVWVQINRLERDLYT